MGFGICGRAIAAGTVALSVIAGAHTHAASRQTPQGAPKAPPPSTQKSGQPPVNADAKEMATFLKRVKEYLDLHNKLEATLPHLPKEATPQQIDQHQRALSKLIQDTRNRAKPGDVFTPDSRRVVLKLMRQVFSGPDGKQLRDSIMDENPGNIHIAINGRYPDAVPLSTVPPQVLAGLPRLPDDLEFRFIGRRLILMDVHAHTIVDYVDNAIPA